MSTDIVLEPPPAPEQMNGSHPPLILDEDILGQGGEEGKEAAEKGGEETPQAGDEEPRRREKIGGGGLPHGRAHRRTGAHQHPGGTCRQGQGREEEERDHQPALSLRQADEERGLQRGDRAAADRTGEDAGLGEGNRRAHRHALRGPRCRRQGRDHPALHREPEPARRACCRAGQALRQRARPVVFPALHRAVCRPRAKLSSSTVPGTTARASSTSWDSARRTSTSSSCARRPSSSA